MKRIVLAAWLIFCCIAAMGCQKREAKEGQAPGAGTRRLNVVTTLFPLYDFAKAVAGDQAQVTLLLPPGVEPHSFEPKPEDMVRVSKADVVVYTNRYMEPWAVKMLGTIPTKPEVVDAGKGVTLLKGGEKHEHGTAEDADHGGIDPHIWLDFNNAQVMVQNIAEGLVRRDPAHRDLYLERAKAYQQELQKLDDDFKSGLAHCRTRTFLEGGHYAFGYLAHRYDLKYQSAQALNPDAEPTPQKLAQLVQEMRKNGLKYVYCEELLSPATADMIARETGAQVLLLNGAHNIRKGDLEKGVSFISLMRQNLENLKKGMGCQ
jgi:zinc transport system substrate-binding protein